MTADAATRIAELAMVIWANLNDAERVAVEAAGPVEGDAHWYITRQGTLDSRATSGDTSVGCPDGCHPSDAQNARNDPAHVLRRVAATRSLVAAILAEPHDWNPLDEYYSCSQARENTGTVGLEVGPPGSGCSDPDRAGQPCDCGRDQRVERLLSIIASEWEDN